MKSFIILFHDGMRAMMPLQHEVIKAENAGDAIEIFQNKHGKGKIQGFYNETQFKFQSKAVAEALDEKENG